MNDRDPYFFVVAALIATVLAAWLIYVPIFMRLLRRFSDAEFRRARGRYFFFGKSVGFMLYYFVSGGYRSLPDKQIRFHGRLIALALCCPPPIIALLFVVDEYVIRG